jgi:hypothetical protein
MEKWLKLLKREKKLSSLDLETPDVTYEVWELGRILARITEACWRVRLASDEPSSRSRMSELATRIKYLSISLAAVYNRLTDDRFKTLGNVGDLGDRIASLSAGIKEATESGNWDPIGREIVETLELVGCELRSKSVHLSNIFSFSYGLRLLKAKIMYDLSTGDLERPLGDDIRRHISKTIDLLEDLRKGDKILASHNLEMTRQNLKIVRIRLKGIRDNLPAIRRAARVNPAVFRDVMNERCNMWTELILDLKNPGDYLLAREKCRNWVLPFLSCYYLIVLPLYIPGVPAAIKDGWDCLKGESTSFIPLFVGLIPPLLALFCCLCRKIREELIIWSFRFKIKTLEKTIKHRTPASNANDEPDAG